MDTPPILVNPTRAGYAPSSSTWASGIGGAAAVVIISLVHQTLHWHVDAETAAAITTLCSALAGYLPQSGRKST